MNTTRFLENPSQYFEGSYEQFAEFGGPCVYFHEQCLRAGAEAFLSVRHVEMIYATLTAWGMHRMGDAKTKLVSWDRFSTSLLNLQDLLEPLRCKRMIDLSEAEYMDAVNRLKTSYCSLKVSISEASIVANSKVLFHVLPELIPPIDRQYTWRFFHAPLERWRYESGKYRNIQLPSGLEYQFDAFCNVCLKIKRLADATGRLIIEKEKQSHGVVPPKAVDNAIMKFIRVHS